ncbi:hypothetical protein P692DRAFT_201808538 [Suillus brevipes Sb2]|nr:hypothetical protein P692DRAFT_201808538 [Suillus brevipes Sb2]
MTAQNDSLACKWVCVVRPRNGEILVHIEWKEVAEAHYAKCTETHHSLVGSAVLNRFKNTFDTVFQAHYLELGQAASMSQPLLVKKGKASGLKKLIRKAQSSDEDDNDETGRG